MFYYMSLCNITFLTPLKPPHVLSSNLVYMCFLGEPLPIWLKWWCHPYFWFQVLWFVANSLIKIFSGSTTDQKTFIYHGQLLVFLNWKQVICNKATNWVWQPPFGTFIFLSFELSIFARSNIFPFVLTLQYIRVYKTFSDWVLNNF